jgi:hypothetical protein
MYENDEDQLTVNIWQAFYPLGLNAVSWCYDYCFCVVEHSFTHGNCNLWHLNYSTKVYIQTVAAME